MKRTHAYISVTIVAVFLGSVFLVDPTFAIQTGVTGGQLDAAGGATGLNSVSQQDPRVFIASLIQVALGLMGTLFTGLILLAGYYYAIARGREDFVAKAKSTMVRAVTGLTIILLSYAVTTFIKKMLTALGS